MHCLHAWQRWSCQPACRAGRRREGCSAREFDELDCRNLLAMTGMQWLEMMGLGRPDVTLGAEKRFAHIKNAMLLVAVRSYEYWAGGFFICYF